MQENNASFVIVNGEQRALALPCTVLVLLRELRLVSESGAVRGVAVAVNNETVPKSEHEHFLLKPLDRVEIIHPVGGG